MADTRLPVSRLCHLDERRRALQRWADQIEQAVSGKKPTMVVKLPQTALKSAGQGASNTLTDLTKPRGEPWPRLTTQ